MIVKSGSLHQSDAMLRRSIGMRGGAGKPGAGKRATRHATLRAMSVLSIQSWVAYGRVGNRAAVFPLERLGHEVWPVNTVNFSNHPAYGSYRGGICPPSDIAEVIDEIEARGAFTRCRAVVSGYLGTVGTGEVVLRTVDRLRAVDNRVIFALDPVMGDHASGVYVDKALPDFFRARALAKADIVLPNAFELGLLSGLDIHDVDSAASAATLLLRQGPEMVVVTGLRHNDEISALLVTAGQAWQATTPGSRSRPGARAISSRRCSWGIF